MIMRLLIVSSLFAVSMSVSAADLRVQVTRNGLAAPIEVAVAPRVEGVSPKWSVTKTLAATESTMTFTGLTEGLYVVMARGPQPLQRLSSKANLGANGSVVRLAIPKWRTSLRVTLAGRPVARAAISLTEDELRWSTNLETNDEGRFEGALWEPGLYTADVWRDQAAAPHIVDVTLSPNAVTIDVPDRSVVGHVIGDDGKPVGGATVVLRSQSENSTLTVPTTAAADGRFEFFGVREGSHALTARAPSYLNSDAVAFELHGLSLHHPVDLKLTHGTQRTVRVVDQRNDPIAGASLFTSCDGHIKSTAVTNAEGRAQIALPGAVSCAIFAAPKEGSIAVEHISEREPFVLRVPEGSSSLRLSLKSAKGDAFPDVWLLMRIDGNIVPPAIGRQLAGRGLGLLTDAEGSISLAHIPPGTYEFWPYRSEAEGQRLYDVAYAVAPPISLRVTKGENSATARFQARR
jgi:hypothetical protein